jgi:hypothetical protein
MLINIQNHYQLTNINALSYEKWVSLMIMMCVTTVVLLNNDRTGPTLHKEVSADCFIFCQATAIEMDSLNYRKPAIAFSENTNSNIKAIISFSCYL